MDQNNPNHPLLKKLSLDRSFEEYDNLYSNSLTEKLRIIYFQPLSKGSLRVSILCLLVVTLGTALLSLPFTMKTNGIILSLIIFIISALITEWTLNLITETCIKEDKYDYTELVQKYYSKNIVKLTLIMCLINNLGSIVAWNKFISILAIDVIGYFGYPDFLISKGISEMFLSLIILLFIQIPICSSHKLGNLQFLSVLGFILILYVILVSIIEFPYYFKKYYSYDKIVYFNFNTNFFQSFCIFFFAFGNHSTIMNVLSELRNKDKNRLYKLTFYTHNIEILLYIITMFVGYFSTFNKTSDIYINRPDIGILMLIGKIFYIFVMICNIGMYYYMVSPYLDNVFNNEGDNKTQKKDIIITVTVLTLLASLSFLFSKISNIIALLGATSQIYLIFVTPILLYIKSFDITEKRRKFYIFISFILVSIGVIHLINYISDNIEDFEII